MAKNAKAGYLTKSNGTKSKATSSTGRYFVNLPDLPSLVVLHINFSTTGSLDIELKDEKTDNYISVKTITADAVVRLAIPASGLACNITAIGGTATVQYRTVVLDSVPDLAIEVFTLGEREPPQTEVLGTIGIIEGGTFKKLYQGQPTASIVALYTVPASTATKITYIIISNTTGSDRTIELYHDGSTAGFNILPVSTVVAGGFAEFDGELLMEAGDTIQGKASVTTTLTVTIYGIEKAQ